MGFFIPDFTAYFKYQRTNGPAYTHLISWPGIKRYKTYKTWTIYGKEMTLTFNTHGQPVPEKIFEEFIPYMGVVAILVM